MLETLADYVRGRSVLDCGFVDHSCEHIAENPKTWVHGFLCEHAREVVGVDRVDVSPFAQRNFEVVQGDVESIDLGRRFDVVFAGDIIEHLSNPGRYLDNMHRHLHDDGLLIVTTPNTFGPRPLLGAFKSLGNDPPCNPEHTCWHSPRTIRQLLERHRFGIVELDYFCEVKRFNWLFMRILGRRFGNTMFVVARKRDDAPTERVSRGA